MERAQNRALSVGTYYEEHHIIPKSEGGSNDAANLAKLTAREHFLAHWLLVRIEPLPSRVFAFNMMCNVGPDKRLSTFIPSSRAVAEAREQHSLKIQKLMKGKKVSEKTRTLMSNSKKGWKPSIEWREKKSLSLKGRTLSDKQKEQISKTLKGQKKPEGFGQKIAEANRRTKSKGSYITPEGTFTSAEAAANANNCSASTVWNRCSNDNFPQWELIKK